MLKKLLCSQETAKQRMDTCNNCEHKTIINTCAVCKCILPLKVKFLFSECPKGKWSDTYFTSDEW